VLYKLLGYVAWKGILMYFRSRLPSRQVLAAGFVGAVVISLAASAAKRDRE